MVTVAQPYNFKKKQGILSTFKSAFLLILVIEFSNEHRLQSTYSYQIVTLF